MTRFSAPTASTIEHIARFAERGNPNLLFAGVSVSDESAQLGYLLSRMHYPIRTKYYTCFANSFEEAISGAVKLARHTARAKGSVGTAILVDRDGRIAQHYNPTRLAAHSDLVPGLEVVADIAAASRLLDESHVPPAALVYIVEEDIDVCELRRLVARCAELGVMSIGCDDRDLSRAVASGRFQISTVKFDVHAYGEALTNRMLPFGAFVMTPHAYKIWNHPINALAHSSTFGANGIALSLAITTLRAADAVDHADEVVFDLITKDPQSRNRYFEDHVNPQAAIWLQAFGIDIDIQTAFGADMALGCGRRILDMAGGTGANLRGHNPSDISDLTDWFDPSTDYIGKLQRSLHELTGYSEIYCAVSGATAVETAIALARLALPDRPKILTFDGNFAGKTLLPLSFSRNGPQRSATISDPFRPYSESVIYADPWAHDAVLNIEAILDDREIGLVWFECVQGMSCKAIPQDVLDLVDSMRRSRHFLVGIDEILSGVWRSGDDFFAHSSKMRPADIVTIAKPFSDMATPVGLVLTTPQVAVNAHNYFPAAAARLADQYRNQLTAAIAFNALTAVDNDEAHALRKQQTKELREGLDRICAESSVLSKVIGDGLHIRLEMNRRFFPQRSNSTLTQLVEGSLQDLVLRDCGVIVAQMRLFPPLFMPEGTAARVVEAMQGVTQISVPRVYINSFVGVARGLRLTVSHVLRRSPPRSWGRRISAGWARQGYFRRVASPLVKIDRLMAATTDERFSLTRLGRIPSLTLTVTCLERSNAEAVRLVYAQRRGSTYVAGTNFGRPTHPVWASLLARSGKCETAIAGRSTSHNARILTGDEREVALAYLDEVWQGYSDYDRVSGRPSYVFELSNAGQTGHSAES
ncbi:aminotransferase class III-fold pyridoxal phosphate-dependent enzyme [Antrihabitans spumae]|uniref:Aminotransferase class III-fold pyridoxal phosphate-dependent enzyme n=1 Tax=Antrihabitans spumae TaxID=3373370 RepID=A0ABW7KDE7_9NOCA